MIPLRLELRNFMSYGEDVPALDFSGMHTLCLSGENGNGKSALLDAMTWSLWGESRAGKNRHDDLVRIGADEMSVQFTFELDGQVYRVLRKRSKRAAGNQWELQQETPDQGLGIGWRSLTKETNRDTGEAIQKLLRMSYDTFLNSAYLRQGKADHFVQQTPGERKKILADILDLSRYDQLEAKAKERAMEARAEATDLEREINGIDAQLAHEEGHRQAVAALETRLAEVSAQGDVMRAEMVAVLGRLKELDGQKQAAESLQTQIEAYGRELADLAHDRAGLEAEIAGAQALLSRRESILADFQTLCALRERLEQLEQDVTQWHRGQQALAAAQREWDMAERDLHARVRRASDAHEEAVQSVKDLPALRQERDRDAEGVAAFDRQAEQDADLDQRLAGAQERLSALKEEDARLGEQARAWEERLSSLAGQQGVCLVCSAPLSAERARSVREEYQSALDDLALRRKDLRSEGARAKSEVTALLTRQAQARATQRQATDARVRLGQIEQQVLKMEARAADVPKLAAHMAEVTAQWEGGAFAPEAKVKIERIRQGLERYANAEADHATAKAQASVLAPAERLRFQLDQAAKDLESAQARLSRTDALTRQREQSRSEAQQQWAGLANVGAEVDTLTVRRDELKQIEGSRRQERDDLSRQIGSHRLLLDQCHAQREARAEKDNSLKRAKRDWEVHDQLSKAFGKKGVQALIIENAIPELQEEANRLLERLTDGDMSLFFDTLKEGKAKRTGPIETLEINVSDSLGTRPLEMYSGGEAFRASFAIRIALSKLLARRAGARLQTLIIDEGFGTQDGKGREKLVDALAAIGQDFERIIVITHIDELKEAFPTRVEIVKTPAGSQITVMEGGAG